MAKKQTKRGRPKVYKEEFNKQAEKLCKLGSIDKDLADFFEICEATLNNWKNEFPGFLESIKRGKDLYDTDLIEASLKHRARGYSHEEEKVFCQDGLIITHETTKHYPPDTTAMIFWLKNRNPDRWNDKIEVEHSGDITIEI